AARRPGHDALVLPERRWTYAAAAAEARRVAAGLIALGIGRGAHVGILMPKGPEFVAAFFGIALTGAVAVPVNARFRGSELGYVVENADLAALLVSDAVDEHADFVARLHEG